MQTENIKKLIEKAFEVSETISEFKKYVLDIIDAYDPKIIINIETLQKNYAVGESKEQADEAVKALLKALNDMQSGGM